MRYVVETSISNGATGVHCPQIQIPLDFITMLAPSTRVNCGCITTKAREEGANMIIIGVDFHPSMQEIAFLDQETGEYVERQLNHSDGEAEKFYRELAAGRS